MTEIVRLPPPYRLHSFPAGTLLDSHLRRLAAAGADPATVVHLDRDDRLECAILLAPEQPLREARLVVYAGALGLGDGLGAVVPAGVDVTYRWPATILANLGAVGRVGLIVPEGTGEDDVPPWMALRLAVAVSGSAGDFDTTLHEEGCAELTTADVLASFAKHFLVWVNRWQDDGFGPLRAMWLRHAPDHGNRVVLRLGKRKVDGSFDDIDDDGALVMTVNNATRRIGLARVLGT